MDILRVINSNQKGKRKAIERFLLENRTTGVYIVSYSSISTIIFNEGVFK
jgi:hypothetical protein